MLAINTSNLHVGGAVQVAVSFISELTKLRVDLSRFSLFVSTEVHAGLSSVNCDTSCFGHFELIDVYGISFSNYVLNRRLGSFDVVFTLFGPLYCFKKKFRSIVGFAQPWIVYPKNECYAKLPRGKRFLLRFKYLIQSFFFRKADLIVVELEHVKRMLIKELGMKAETISVVHNSISSIYFNPDIWKPVTWQQVDCDIRLGFVGRNYYHKNTELFVEIADQLEKVYKIKCRFFVTFTPDEWVRCSPEFRKVSVNFGQLSVDQCPTFYQMVDAVIFPSMLECFSATPLEAMVMNKLLFASDRPFNRDICDDHAIYFDPLSAVSAANSIAHVFLSLNTNESFLSAARNHAINFSNPNGRALKYVSLMMEHSKSY